MDSLLILANWLLPLAYLAVLAAYGAGFFLRASTEGRSPAVLAVIALHVATLIGRGMYVRALPLGGNYEILSAVALAAAGVYWLLEWVGRDRRAGVFVFALVFLFQYTSSLALAGTPAAAGAGEHVASRLHVLPAIVAYTALAYAAVYGALHLLAQRNLKQHRFGLLFDRLPPLDRLGQTTWHALLVGFAFMTASIVTGAVTWARGGGPEVSETKVLTKAVLGSAAWSAYVVAIVGRAAGKWAPTRVAAIAVAGFVVTMALLISSILLP